MLGKFIQRNGRLLLACLWVAAFFTLFSNELWGWVMPLPLWAVCYFAGGLAVAQLAKLSGRCEPLMRLNRRLSNFIDSNLTDREFLVFIWIFIMIPWLAAYLALFPGTYGYDVPVQAAQFFEYGDLYLTSHHPVAHTVLVSAFLFLGDKLLHSYTAGFALYTAFQALMVTGCAARSLAFLKRRGVPLPVIALGALWAAWNPVLQILGMNATKDILFGVFLLHFVMEYWDSLSEKKRGRRHWVRLAVSAALMCLFRNQGIYILFVLLVLTVLFRVRIRALYIALLAAFLFCNAFFAFCTYGLKIEAVNRREMLSVPMQQVTYVCHAYLSGDKEVHMTKEQLRTVEEVITDEGVLKDFHSDSADPVKSTFHTEILEHDLMRYMKTYIEIGIQNPRYYWEAMVIMVMPYWDMSINEYCSLSMEYTFPELNFPGIERQSLLEEYCEYLTDIVLRMRQGFLLSVSGAALWILVILSGIAIARGDRELFLGRMPMVLYVLTMLLGPMALLRYLFPVMLATPLLWGALFLRKRCGNDSTKQSAN